MPEITAAELVNAARTATLAATEPIFIPEWGTAVQVRVVPPSAVMEYQAIAARMVNDPGVLLNNEASWLQAGIVSPEITFVQALDLMRNGGPAVLRLLDLIKAKSLSGQSWQQWALEMLRQADPALGLLADLFEEVRQGHDLVDFLRAALAEIPGEAAILQTMDLAERVRDQWDKIVELEKKLSSEATPGRDTESIEPASTNSIALLESFSEPVILGATSPA